MTIVHCPRCRDEVTVPAKASPQALVRCPLCLEEYLLAEALAEMPPTLLVVGGEMEEEPALVGAGAAATEAGGDYNLSGGGYGAGVLDSSAPAGATVTPARTGVKTGARPKRKEKSALGEMIKIVLGGVVGLSLGLLVLWWGLRKDPLKLGPKVSPYAPWIVPAEFHGKPVEGGTTVQNNSEAGSSAVGANSNASSLAPAPQDIGTTIQTLPDPLAGEQGGLSPVSPASIDLPSLEPVPTTPEENPTETPPATATNPPNGNAKTAGNSPDFTNLLPEGRPPLAEANPSTVAATDLATAVQAANDALAKFDEATGKKEPKEVRQQLFTDLYLAVADAGRVVSHLNPEDADVADPLAQLRRFLSEVAAQPGKVSAFGHLGRTHLPERKVGEGFVIPGKVIEYRASGSVFETTLDAGSDVRVLFVSRSNPQDFCEVGDELLVAGRVVDEPAKNIDGYEGEAQRVMLLGHAAQISKAE